MNIVGIIPARGGSKGVKNKNILDLCGKPVIGYAIEAALNASSLDKVVVSTDSEKIASVVRKLYDVEVIMRPVELAKDDSPIEEALLHAVEYLRENQNYNSDIVAWMQANVPIRQDGIIDVVVNKLINSDADSCVTCYEIEQMPEWMNIINEKERLELISKDIGAIRRQELPERYLLDGSVFAVRAKNLFETRGIRKLYVYLGTEIIPVVQEKQMYSLEIDVPGDFSLIQYYMEKINKEKVNKLPHFILEVANNHAGDINVIKNLILQFSELDYPDLGIKFQAFKYDTIALPDYRWYESYKEFFICKEAWKEIIELAHRKIGKVWLDIFCVYGLEVFKENKDSIWGIKLQASVLRNAELLSFLENIELSDKELIVNLSGYELSEINEFISELNDLNFKKIILQIGFQHYPTTIRDTSLRKIDIIKASFPGLNISFADHLAAEDEFSKKFPVYAYLKGCNYIEKHVCHSRKRSKYDYFSALEFDEVKKIIVELKKVNECFSAKFIPKNEMVYLETTFQKPVLKRDLDAGQLIADADLVYRRTDREGMDSKDLYALQSEFYIINRKLEENHTLIRSDFKRAKMAVIVAARMKSTRLKKKAVLPICGSASVERCLESCLKFSFVDDVILATSFLKNDEILKKHTLGGKVKFWQGDPSDVISRFIGACEAYGVDVVIRVTADCPVVSPEIAKILLRAHFKNGADFTEAKHLAVGTNSDIYNVEALKRVIRYIGKGKDTAYMGWFMRNNPELFKINVVDLPADLVRDYRLTLDYKEDLDMFNALYRKLEEKGLDVDLPNIFAVLDENPEIPVMNSHLAQVYEVDQELIHRLNKETKIAANV